MFEEVEKKQADRQSEKVEDRFLSPVNHRFFPFRKDAQGKCPLIVCSSNFLSCCIVRLFLNFAAWNDVSRIESALGGRSVIVHCEVVSPVPTKKTMMKSNNTWYFY